MKYPAFLAATVRTQAWLDADDQALATWLRLIIRCGDDENSGVLAGCERWGDRTWIAFANVSRTGIDACVAAGLCDWDGPNLIVVGYDGGAQKKVETLRENGKFGHMGGEFGHLGGRPKKKKNPQEKPPSKTKGVSGDENPHKPPLTLPSPSDPNPTLPTNGDPPWGGYDQPESEEVRAARMFSSDGIVWAIRREVERLHPEIGLWQPGYWAGRALGTFLDAIKPARRTPALATEILGRIRAFAASDDPRVTKGRKWSVEAFCENYNALAPLPPPERPRRAPAAGQIPKLPPASPIPVASLAEARAARVAARSDPATQEAATQGAGAPNAS